MARFAGDRSRPGYFFTLNQDLFVERHYGNSPPNAPLALLGLGRGARLQSTFGRILDSRDQIALPARMSPLTAQTGDAFYFVKLHGSCNWLASDGSQRMVIGRGKRQQIAEEPILAAYLGLFEEVLCSSRKRLLVTGYGFQDEHINRMIATAIEQRSRGVHSVTAVFLRAERDD